MNTNTLKTKQLEVMLASLLHYGSWLSSAVTALGLALVMIEGHLGASALRLPSGTTIVTAGIALLIMLPVLRLAVMLFAFVRERDYMFGMIAATVLAIIAFGTALGLYLPVHDGA
ncbi:MAG TPA: DUF1634 domain-containing protein [Paraburkholderia sp.]|jgi:uncharacterized membrane protein|nr:DUF1634 domain-containing protein [Paraburkholderia sp.]